MPDNSDEIPETQDNIASINTAGIPSTSHLHGKTNIFNDLINSDTLEWAIAPKKITSGVINPHSFACFIKSDPEGPEPAICNSTFALVPLTKE